jgi:hypothetical protein
MGHRMKAYNASINTRNLQMVIIWVSNISNIEIPRMEGLRRLSESAGSNVFIVYSHLKLSDCQSKEGYRFKDMLLLMFCCFLP